MMKEGGRIFSDAFYDCNKRPVHFPSTLRPSQVVREIREITRRHLTRGLVLRNLITHHDFQALITRKGVVKSGFLDRVLESVPALQQIEKDYYDSNDLLREDLLLRHQEQGVIAERMLAVAN
jgi:hypothetical protein